MALLNNNNRFLGGARCRYNGANTNRYEDVTVRQNIYTGTTADPKSGIPAGTKVPGSFLLPLLQGGLSSFTLIKSASSVSTADAQAGLNLASALSAQASLSASLGLILDLLASISVSGQVTTSQLRAIADIAANITASGAVTTSDMGAIIDMIAGLSGAGTMASFATSLANMSVLIGGPSELSPEGLAESLLDGEEIEGGYTMREALRIILAALAGKLSGGGTSTVTIRDINDLKDRIIATVDANGNRTSVTHNVSE